MYRRGWPALILMLAICSLALAAGFTFGDGSIHWFWAGAPLVAAGLVAVSLTCWGTLLLLRRTRA
ncbi:hypothetical protein [Paeniglutamicibacter cryotolerans]|uniref:DUF3955 domain-containing protein n=1 Tax=Paeniglutamicibacter cryotolerans TaxID=670079 RepID=A0A839QQA6_9MICC|nr:hypothetical protein [Paeniglutamicibacter cryotolerans]MBB2996944.1 hypothetical protein [Paeniglutamicibacter cryotolerans]